MNQEGEFKQVHGIFVPGRRILHREDEYDERVFEVLIRMQRDHYWYRGRHRLLLNVLQRELSQRSGKSADLRMIDMGGGCGGWLEYLHAHDATLSRHLALGDSSMRALSLAEGVVGSFATRYQIDLLDLPWLEQWDVVFLLDVLEHIPDHREVLRQVFKSMKPGGLLFVTTPALQAFWTYNDDLVHHQRRYCREDFRLLADGSGFELLRSDYFMFFLSPALILSRTLFRPPPSATPEQLREHLAHTHQIPRPSINKLLSGIFSLEVRLAEFLRFPWGTSILGVFKKREENAPPTDTGTPPPQ